MTTLTRSVTLLVFSACATSSTANKAPPTHNLADFECKDRSAEYTIAGGMMSHHESGLVEPEVGVIVTCTGDRLRIEKWRLIGADGNRKSSSHSLTPDEFEEFWVQIESVGWRNIRDCDNPEAADDDPIHAFAISDDSASQNLTCQGKVLPFPFNRLRNTFDLTAGAYD